LFCLTALLIALWPGGVSASGVGNFCPIGTCVIDNPVYVNVFWDDSPAKWDSDNAATGITEELVNGLISGLIASDYFAPLSQYKVYTPTMAPSITVPCGGLPSALPGDPSVTFPGHTPDLDKMVQKVVDCVFAVNGSLNNGNTIINLFVPPQVGGGGYCTGSRAANHDKFSSPVEVTLLPATSACSGSLFSIIFGASHEMVEAATDPLAASPTGYKNKDTSQWGQEIADLCESLPAAPFLGLGVTQYWSDNAHGCVNSFDSSQPVISKVVLCGSGNHMDMFLQGTFGPAPSDLSSGLFGGQTLYLSLAVSGKDNWSAGNVLAGNAIGLGGIVWRTANAQSPTDTIDLQGFNSAYGSGGNVVHSGDRLTVTVFQVKNGQSRTATFTAPSPAALQYDPPPILNVGGKGAITGIAFNGSGCGIEGVSLTLAVSRGSISTSTGSNVAVTKSDGAFAAIYMAPPVAGLATLTASSAVLPKPTSETFPVSPVLGSIAPTGGPVAGGTKVTVSGQGFDNTKGATKASINGVVGPENNLTVAASPTVMQVSADHKTAVLTMPLSPFQGAGAVVTNNGGSYNGRPPSPGAGGTNPFKGGGEGLLTLTVNGAVSNYLTYTYICTATSC
jgi:hypothetical protein